VKLSTDLFGYGHDAPAAGIAQRVFQNLNAKLEIIENRARNAFFYA
jgi:hypothetical protein